MMKRLNQYVSVVDKTTMYGMRVTHMVKLIVQEYLKFDSSLKTFTTYTLCDRKLTDVELYQKLGTRILCETCLKLLDKAVQEKQPWSKFYEDEVRSREWAAKTILWEGEMEVRATERELWE